MSTFRQVEVSSGNITTTTNSDELQVRNAQDHQRIFDPINQKILLEILQELQKMNMHLSMITEEEL